MIELKHGMSSFKITRLTTGGFVVKDGFHDNVFASTNINEALMFIKDKLQPDPFKPEKTTT